MWTDKVCVHDSGVYTKGRKNENQKERKAKNRDFFVTRGTPCNDSLVTSYRIGGSLHACTGEGVKRNNCAPARTITPRAPGHFFTMRVIHSLTRVTEKVIHRLVGCYFLSLIHISEPTRPY